MGLIIKSDLCVSCGMCVSCCGEIFYFGEDSKAKVNKENVEAFDEGIIKECEQMCPVGAIEYIKD